MKSINSNEMRQINGGKYCYAVCNKCGKKFPGASKTSAWIGWFLGHSIWHHSYGVHYIDA